MSWTGWRVEERLQWDRRRHRRRTTVLALLCLALLSPGDGIAAADLYYQSTSSADQVGGLASTATASIL